MGKLILREYSEADREEIVELLKRGHTKDYSIERWNWLHHNSVTQGSKIIVAVYEGKIVGNVASIRKRFFYNETEYVGGRHIDPVVDNSMRGKGVFTKMLHALNEAEGDVDFIYTFPNLISFPGFLKAGYKSAGPIPPIYCQFVFSGLKLKEKIRYILTGMRIAGRTNKKVIKGNFEDLKDLKPKLPKDKFCLYRDYNYLCWRFKESPLKSYEVLICKSGNEIESACIILKNDKMISIMDVIEYNHKIEISEYLVALRDFYGAVIVEVWDNNLKSIRKYFIGNKYHGQNFCLRVSRDEMPKEIFVRTNWYITAGEVESN